MREAIVLVGGRGTRLKSISGETPKPLVEVGGKPFVYWILEQLQDQGFERVILATGYRADVFESLLTADAFSGMEIVFSVEETPLGTGGAIRKAMELVQSDSFCVLNGDSFCATSFDKLISYSQQRDADLCVVAAKVDDVSRFGQIHFSDSGKVSSLTEKGGVGSGYINSGIYYFSKTLLSSFAPDTVFSFESEILEKISSGFYAMASEGYFIDIGIPEDYAKANSHFHVT